MTGRGGRPADIFVDVNVAGRFLGTISVREGDNAGLLASEFVREHNLHPRHTTQLSELVKSKIAEYNTEQTRRLAIERRKKSRKELQQARMKEPTKAESPEFRSHARILRRKSIGGRLAKRERVLVGRMHVRVGKGKTGVLVVRRGDDPEVVVENFRRTFALKKSQAASIETQVRTQLEKFESEYRARHMSASPVSYAPRGTPSSARVVRGTDVEESPIWSAAKSKPEADAVPGLAGLTEYQRKLFETTLRGTPPEKTAEENAPLFNLDVDIGRGERERILVRNGDNPAALAREFSEQHDLSPTKCSRLEKLLTDNMSNFGAL